ncbi:MAG: RdgB/HAM1 family non-canonical purine NTP pyrophosphatase [Gammaproteobacteria bacterium]|nr:RdgB/HAM1 family non-canonical purine NTP pyrophosphatase [Gammaproteobacteria bacterium]
MTQTLVVASSNAGKLKEFSALLADRGFTIKPQSDYAIEDAIEDGLSFVENAIIKARHAARHSGCSALADDSGIEVDALNGAPGIYSSRFASMHNAGSGDQDNNTLLLEKLQGLTDEQRTARFRSVIVLMRHAEDPAPIIAEGTWEGRILHAPTGEGGFGYDPLFFAPEKGCAAAELDKQTKNSLSHRGKALRSLLERL